MINRRRFMISAMASGVLVARSAGSAMASHFAAEHAALPSGIPDADDLAAEWCTAAELKSLPSVHNTLGAAATDADILSVSALAFPPLSFGGTSAELLLNGKTVAAQQYRWYPYQILRRGVVEGVEVQTAVALLADQPGVLFRIRIHNPGSARNLHLTLNFQGMIRQYAAGWAWPHPSPRNPTEFSITLLDDRSGVTIKDSKSPALAIYQIKPAPQHLHTGAKGAHGTWRVNLAAKDAWRADMVLVCGQWPEEVQAQARAAVYNFDARFDGSRASWQRRYAAAFTPGNSVYSGSLPRLQTADEKVRRVYYMSVASLLDLCRTGMPLYDRAYVTGSPQDAVTVMYFWDTSTWATVFSLLDPAILRRILLGWLKLNIHSCYAQDCLTGKGVGPWYSFNDYVVFSLLLRYVCVTGDRDFLLEPAGSGTVMEAMDQIATWWRKLVRPGTGLADYGGVRNLLECVPSYIGIVPSLNAANVFMMRQTARLWRQLGRHRRADELENLAHELAGRVMGLYVGGQGYWACLHADGRRVPVRTCIDFFTITQCMADDISPAVRQQMLNFVSTQLLTDHWMRALSPLDPAARSPLARRPDHGWTGAYDAWPAYTVEAMAQLGEPAAALAFMQRCEGVTRAGPFGQSHELIGRSRDAPASKTQMYDLTAGGCFAEVIIRSLFGFYPLPGRPMLRGPRVNRYFSGSLYNVKANGRYLDLISSSRGISVTPVTL